MKIKMLENCVGNRFSYTKGATLTVTDKVGKDLVKAGYAELLDKKSQPADEETEQTQTAQVKAEVTETEAESKSDQKAGKAK